MGILRKEVFKQRGAFDCPVKTTYGYITKNTRIQCGLPKEHVIDARCISGNPLAKNANTVYWIKPLRRHNRQLHKASILKGGIRKNNQGSKEIFGFRRMDTIKFNGQIYYIKGRRVRGSFSLTDILGNEITNSVTYKKLQLIAHNNNYIIREITL